jgi:hypothetical protein
LVKEKEGIEVASNVNFLQEKAVEATKQEKERKVASNVPLC